MGARWVAVSLLLVACHHGGDDGAGKGDGGGINGGGLKSNIGLDLGHVLGFAIVGTPGSPRLDTPAVPACMPSTLYAVMDTGDLVVTTVSQNDATIDAGCSTSMMTERATALFDTTKYLVIDYETAGTASCSAIVMRKSDGALFCFDPPNPRAVQGDGDILYAIGDASALSRIDMAKSPPESTLVDDTAATGESISRMYVNSVNDALAGGSPFGVRVFRSSGGLTNVSAQNQCYWYDAPADTFYHAEMNLQTAGNPSYLSVSKLAPGTYASTEVGRMGGIGRVAPCAPNGNYGLSSVALSSGTQQYSFGDMGGGPAIFELAGKGARRCWSNALHSCSIDSQCAGTCTAQGYCQGGGKDGYACTLPGDCVTTCDTANAVCISASCSADADCASSCVTTPTNGMRCNGGSKAGAPCALASDCFGSCVDPTVEHKVTGMTMIKNGFGAGTHIFLQGTDAAGNGTIAQVDVTSFQQMTLLAPGDYTVTATSVSKSGDLLFAGLRNADGANVVGKCTLSGCTVLNATAPHVSALEQLH